MYAYLAEEFATELINVRSDTELDGALKLVSRRLGFDHFALSLEMRSTSYDAPGLLLHDYPDEWAKVYIAFDLAGQDPVRRACDKTITGFAWDWLDELVPLTRGDRQMLGVGRECGIGNGYTVPRHLPGVGRGTCTFAVRPERELPSGRLAAVEMIGTNHLRHRFAAKQIDRFTQSLPFIVTLFKINKSTRPMSGVNGS